MMGTNNLNWSFQGLHLHMLFAVIFLVGVVLFVVWAVKTMDKKALASWTLWLLIIGIAGMLLTAGWGVGAWPSMHGYGESDFKEMVKYMSER